MVYFLCEDGNSELKGRFFPLGSGIRKHLEQTLLNYNGDKSCAGYKRLNNILSMPNGIAYNEMKRIKNFFDNFQGNQESPEYILNGGDGMKLWVNNTLNTATSAIEGFKQAKKDAGFKNAFRKEHSKDRQNNPSPPTLSKIQTKNLGKNIANNDTIKYVKENKTIATDNAQGTANTVRYENVNRRTIIINEQQARLLNEGAETRNMSAAKHYLYQNNNCNEQQALKIIGAIKTDIPNSRLGKCKFMLAMVRMFCNGDLSDGKTIMEINKSLKYAASDAHINEYNQDLNGLTPQQLIERFTGVAQQDLDQDKQQIAAQQYTPNNSQYRIVKINSFEDAEQYGNYVGWCITHDSSMFDSYTGGGEGVFYFCLRDGFENMHEVSGENCPLDEYGLSMIAVSVNSDGSCNTITCRWNHTNGGNDHIMSPKELSQIINMNFYQVFKPRTQEEIAQIQQQKLGEIEQEFYEENEYYSIDEICNEIVDDDLDGTKAYIFTSRTNDLRIVVNENGETLIEEVFTDVDQYSNGGIVNVTKGNKENFLSLKGNLLSQTWFDEVTNYFERGYGLCYVKNKGWTFIYKDGAIANIWYDSIGSALVGNGNYVEVIKNKLINFVNINDISKPLLDVWAEDIHGISNRLMLLKQNGLWRVYRKDTLKQQQPYEIEWLGGWYGDYYQVKLVGDNRKYYIHIGNGNLITQEQYEKER